MNRKPMTYEEARRIAADNIARTMREDARRQVDGEPLSQMVAHFRRRAGEV